MFSFKFSIQVGWFFNMNSLKNIFLLFSDDSWYSTQKHGEGYIELYFVDAPLENAGIRLQSTFLLLHRADNLRDNLYIIRQVLKNFPPEICNAIRKGNLIVDSYTHYSCFCFSYRAIEQKLDFLYLLAVQKRLKCIYSKTAR